MKSMTGYGTASGQSKDVELEVSLRAVNGRFLDLRFHAPKEYSGLESEIKKIVSASLKRGTVDVYLNRRHVSLANQANINVDSGLAKKWLKAYRELGKTLNLEDDSSLQLVASQPNIFLTDLKDKVSTGEKKLLQDTLKKAIDSCEKERKREGLSLKKDLLTKLSDLGDLAGSFESLKAEANKELSKKIKARLKKLSEQTEVDEQRLAQEVVIQIDKGDINEELIRLKEHLRAMKALINGKSSQGKKLDFYCQELLREVNTIGSKSQIARLTEHVVDAKAIVERVREQVQNVE